MSDTLSPTAGCTLEYRRVGIRWNPMRGRVEYFDWATEEWWPTNYLTRAAVADFASASTRGVLGVGYDDTWCEPIHDEGA